MELTIAGRKIDIKDYVPSQYKKITCVTGRRPFKIADPAHAKIAFGHLLSKIRPDFIWTGMARGADTWAAEWSLINNIPFGAIVPHKGQEERWGKKDQELYYQLLSKAQTVVTLSDRYYTGCMNDRNLALVEISDTTAGLWEGKKEGGTYMTIEIALFLGKEVVTYDPDENTYFRYDYESESFRPFL